MKNDTYIVIYCNDLIATFNDFQEAINFVKEAKNNDIYAKKDQFNIYIKTDLC